MSRTELATTGNFSESAISAHIDKWKKIAMSNARVDGERLRDGVSRIYRMAKLRPPDYVFWFGSPIAGALAASLLSKSQGQNIEPDIRHFYQSLQKNLKRVISNRSDKAFWLSAEKQINGAIQQTYGTVAQEIRRAIQIQLAVGTFNDFAREGVGIYDTEGSLSAILNQLFVDFRQQLPPVLQEVIDPLTQEPDRIQHIFAAASNTTYTGHLGSMDTEMPFFEFCSLSGLKMPDLSGFVKASESAGWWWPLKDYCIVTERPKVFKTDEQGNLHSARGPALQYSDSWGFYSWHGRIVPPRFLSFARNPAVHDILHEPNVELRRLMIDTFGLEQFMLASGARLLQQDECGELYVQPIDGDEPIVMVRVTNSTAEPEGHFKKYFLRVPPTTRTAREGIAWTFGLTENEYKPLKQT